jgi:signal peptidase II
MSPKLRLFLPCFLVLFLADCTSKQLVEEALGVPHVPHEVLGETVRLTLAYNPGAALGIWLGPWSRPGLILIGAGVLTLLTTMLVRAAPTARLQVVALGLVMGGAMGNLRDRLTSPLGVVDFIDVGIGTSRFYTFNVADAGIFLGALLLAWALWREDAEREAALEEPA